MTSEYTMPDGNSYVFDSDEDATNAMMAWDKQFSQQPRQAAPPAPEQNKVMQYLINPFNRAAGGIGEAALQMGSGLGASALGGAQGLFDLATGDTLEQAADTIRSTQGELTYQPRTAEGQAVSKAIAAPIEYGSKALGYLGGGIGGMIGGEQGRIAGESIGEVALPLAATAMMGKAPIQNIAKTQFEIPNVPVVTPFVSGMRDVVRARSDKGIQKLAENVIKDHVPASEIPLVLAAVERKASSVVPNSPVSTADAIARANRQFEIMGQSERFGGTLVALQEGLSKFPETTSSLVKIELGREIARRDLLNEGAKTEKIYKEFEGIRAKNAHDFEKIRDVVIETDKNINMLMTRPSMEKAFEIAKNNALEQGKPFSFGKDIPEQIIPSTILDASGKPISQTVIPAQFAKYPVGTLQQVKVALDKMIAKPKDHGIEAMQLRDVAKTRAELITWLEGKSDAYAKANAQYAIDSLPLNRMDLWNTIKEKMITPAGKENPSGVLKALRDEQKLIKEATGYAKGKSLGDIFNKKESLMADRLAMELEIELYKTRMAKEVNVHGLGRSATDLSPKLPNLLTRETAVANFLLKTLAKDANVPVNIAVGKILADPKMVASILKNIKPEHRTGVLKAIKNSALTKETAVAASSTIEPPLEINIYGGQE